MIKKGARLPLARLLHYFIVYPSTFVSSVKMQRMQAAATDAFLIRKHFTLVQLPVSGPVGNFGVVFAHSFRYRCWHRVSSNPVRYGLCRAVAGVDAGISTKQ